MYPESRFIAISTLQHWIFCPRQCGLIHLEGIWSENWLTAQGKVMHKRAHEGGIQRRGPVRIERAVPLHSLTLGLSGIADVVEFHKEPDAWRPFPVEYKRGKPKAHDADIIQLCAQAVCLEEMLQTRVETGALLYGAQCRRHEVAFDSGLRANLIRCAAQVRVMFDSGITPEPQPGIHCKSCSLVRYCLPDHSKKKSSGSGYLAKQIGRALKETL